MRWKDEVAYKNKEWVFVFASSVLRLALPQQAEAGKMAIFTDHPPAGFLTTRKRVETFYTPNPLGRIKVHLKKEIIIIMSAGVYVYSNGDLIWLKRIGISL